ncbi:MAG: hypothetical protein HDS82_07415 [Bacteroidales bacterium]|nr:hypothetical protein [Bacteroidales bacterium]
MWETLLTIAGALGGVETLKYFLERRVNMRRAATQADSDDFHILRETTEFLQAQLRLKEERFAEQTERLRELQRELYSESERRHCAELNLVMTRCDNLDCPSRRPPRSDSPESKPPAL